MTNLIGNKTFHVNINWSEEFSKPIDLNAVTIVSDVVRGKSGIFFISLERTASLDNHWKGKTFDSWTFMDVSLRDAAFEKLIKKKYGFLS